MKYFILIAFLLLPLRVHAAESIILQEQAGACFATVEAVRDQGVLSIRMSRDNEGSLSCNLDRGQTLALISHIDAALTAQNDHTVYNSIFLRQLRNYNWLARFLADSTAQDLGWNNAMGAPADGLGVNRYVNATLSDPAILGALNNVAPRWRFTGFSCEKTFVSGPQTAGFEPSWLDPGQRLPFDAICWLTLDQAP